MATHHGKEGVVKVGSDTIAEIKEFQVESSVEITDDTVMGDAWKTHKPGQKAWSGSLNCQWDETDSTGQEVLTEGASVTLNFYPEGAGTGAKYLTGVATISNITVAAAMDGIVARNFQFTGNGALAWSTVAP